MVVKVRNHILSSLIHCISVLCAGFVIVAYSVVLLLSLKSSLSKWMGSQISITAGVVKTMICIAGDYDVFHIVTYVELWLCTCLETVCFYRRRINPFYVCRWGFMMMLDAIILVCLLQNFNIMFLGGVLKSAHCPQFIEVLGLAVYVFMFEYFCRSA